MAGKSIIDTRTMVPEYFGNNREFQVFLRAINIALSVIKSNSDNFIPNLLNPLKCKAKLLPLLANYVGYDYNPKERVVTNRWITKLYPLLVRNRGSELGITLAVSMAICLMADPENLDWERNFSLEYEDTYDKYGRKINTLKLYIYTTDYLPILKDLIETVRPAGLKIEYIPATTISSSETIALTDEYAIAKYDYTTGKLLSINDVNITVQNSWPLLVDEHAIKHYRWKHLQNWNWGRTETTPPEKQVMNEHTWGEIQDTGIDAFGAMPSKAPYNIDNKNTKEAEIWNDTGIRLVDGRFYDRYGNDLNRILDSLTGRILYETIKNDKLGNSTPNYEWIGEYVKDTRIYAETRETKTEINPTTGEKEEVTTVNRKYTGIYFDVSEPAKVMNTYYKLLDDGIFSNFYLSKDNMQIYNGATMFTEFKLIEEPKKFDIYTKNVWRVVNPIDESRYEWYVDMESRKFIRDGDGKKVNYPDNEVMPFRETTYIGKKAFIMDIEKDDTGKVTSITATKYFVNKYGDIIDLAGNVILSKKDRYKVSDSNMIGFSEVHNNAKGLSTFDSTNILGRDWSYMKDDHIQDVWGKNQTNDFEEYERVVDPRYKLDHYSFDIGTPVREYTGTELIKFISNDDLKAISAVDGYMTIQLFTSSFDNENASGVLKIKTDIPNNYTLADVFKNMNIRYENKMPNDELNPSWDIFIDWVPNTKNTSVFNLNDLENPIHFIKKGKIEPRTLHWTRGPIYIAPKVYDGTTKVFIKGDD